MTVLAWYNWAERHVDYRDAPPQDDTDARQYIPQEPATFDRYAVLRKSGYLPAAAAEKVMAEYADGEI